MKKDPFECGSIIKVQNRIRIFETNKKTPTISGKGYSNIKSKYYLFAGTGVVAGLACNVTS